MASYLNNPAGRLHDFIAKGRGFKPVGDTYAVLCNLLSINPTDKAKLLHTLGLVHALPAQIETRVRAIPNLDHDVYLEWVPTVLTAFCKLNLAGDWNDFIGKIDAKTLYGLKVCAEVLGRECAEPELKQDELDKLRPMVRDLIDEILQTEINETLKQYLLKHLEMIDRAIDDYGVHGAEAIVEAVERAVGSIYIQRATAKPAISTVHGKRFLEILQRIFLILSLAKVMIELPQDIADAILPEPPTVDASAHEAGERIESSPCTGEAHRN